jgi:hypothetical protein
LETFAEMAMASTFCGVGIKVEKDPSRGLVYVAGIAPGELLLVGGERERGQSERRDSHFLLVVMCQVVPRINAGRLNWATY